MGKRAKRLCDWKTGDLEKNLDDYRKLVRDARFVCRECGRAAAKRKTVCKPVPLDED